MKIWYLNEIDPLRGLERHKRVKFAASRHIIILEELKEFAIVRYTVYIFLIQSRTEFAFLHAHEKVERIRWWLVIAVGRLTLNCWLVVKWNLRCRRGTLSRRPEPACSPTKERREHTFCLWTKATVALVIPRNTSFCLAKVVKAGAKVFYRAWL